MRLARGFTLVEVVVALAVVAIALAAATRAATATVTTQDELRLRLLATWIAENRLAEHQVLRDWPPFGRGEGRSEMAGENFVWVETVSSTPNVQFRRIDIGVASIRAADKPLARLSGYLAEP